jgi:hypothetical protein
VVALEEKVYIPSRLPKVWALARGLKERPLLQEVFLGKGSIGKFVVVVVGIN